MSKNTMSKKKIAIIVVISVLLVVAIALSSYFIVKAIDEKTLEIAVMSDIHVLSSGQMGDTITDSLQKQENKGQKMLVLSEGLLKEGIDKVIKDKQEILLIAGDLTDDGGKISHLAVANELKRAEDKGIKVFVINGNHDINNKSQSYAKQTAEVVENVDAEGFASIYADFGYSEAISRHNESLSYVADLDKMYRLMAIDVSYYQINRDEGYCTDRNNSQTSDDLIAWIDKNLQQAQTDGKRVIAMMHFPLTAHLTELIDNNSTTADKNDQISELFFKYDVKYVFTGHLHSNDIASITYQKNEEKVIYDIETSSLSNYPMSIRYFKGSEEKEEMSTKYMTSIKEKYIPSLIPAETKQEILKDLTAYAKKVVDNGMKNKVMNKIDTDVVVTMLGAMGLEKKASSTTKLAEDIRQNLILDYFDTPLYSNGSGKSVEEISAKYGVSIPKSSYNTVWDVAMELLRANYKGNESLKQDSVEAVLLKYSLYTAFYKIDDYGLFDKIHARNNKIEAYDLAPAMELLFTEGKLDVKNNNLLGILGSITVVARFQERWSTKPVVGTMIASVDLSDADSILGLVGGLLDLMTLMDIKPGTLLEDAGAIGDIIDSIEINSIIDYQQGYINIDGIYALLFGDIGVGLINDKAPNDETLSYTYNE